MSHNSLAELFFSEYGGSEVKILGGRYQPDTSDSRHTEKFVVDKKVCGRICPTTQKKRLADGTPKYYNHFKFKLEGHQFSKNCEQSLKLIRLCLYLYLMEDGDSYATAINSAREVILQSDLKNDYILNIKDKIEGANVTPFCRDAPGPCSDQRLMPIHDGATMEDIASRLRLQSLLPVGEGGRKMAGFGVKAVYPKIIWHKKPNSRGMCCNIYTDVEHINCAEKYLLLYASRVVPRDKSLIERAASAEKYIKDSAKKILIEEEMRQAIAEMDVYQLLDWRSPLRKIIISFVFESLSALPTMASFSRWCSDDIRRHVTTLIEYVISIHRPNLKEKYGIVTIPLEVIDAVRNVT